MTLWRVAVSFSSLSAQQWCWLLALWSYLAGIDTWPSLTQVKKGTGKEKHTSNSMEWSIFKKTEKSLQAFSSQGSAVVGSHRWLSGQQHLHSRPQVFILWDSTLLNSYAPKSLLPLSIMLAQRNCSKCTWQGTVDSWNVDIYSPKKHHCSLGSSSLEEKQ